MANFYTSLNDNGHPVFSLGKSFTGRKIVFNTTDNTTHPARALISASRQFAPAFKTMLDVLDETTGLRPQKQDLDSRLTVNFREVCYRAAELFEVFQTAIPNSIPAVNARSNKSSYKEYKKIVKSSRKDWGFLCNAIKHNHNDIAPVKKVYKPSFRKVYGFMLVRPSNDDTVDVNTDFHKAPERCRAYNLVLRQLIHDIFRVDKAASKLIGHLTEDESVPPLPEKELSLEIGLDLLRLEQKSLWTLSGENKMLDGFKIHDGYVQFVKQATETISEGAEIHQKFSGDGFARKFPLI